MTNTSATGGYLSENSIATPPVEDDAFTNIIQAVIVGITGIAGNLVRPRWQPIPPTQPTVGTTWCAFGIHTTKADTFPFIGHSGTVNGGDGDDFVLRYEDIEVLCSFYGSQANSAAAALRDGLFVAQNREALSSNGMALVSVGDIITMPDLINTQWYYRIDMPIRLRREIMKSYPVLNLLSAAGTITTGNVTVNFNN